MSHYDTQEYQDRLEQAKRHQDNLAVLTGIRDALERIAFALEHPAAPRDPALVQAAEETRPTTPRDSWDELMPATGRWAGCTIRGAIEAAAVHHFRDWQRTQEKSPADFSGLARDQRQSFRVMAIMRNAELRGATMDPLLRAKGQTWDELAPAKQRGGVEYLVAFMFPQDRSTAGH